MQLKRKLFDPLLVNLTVIIFRGLSLIQEELIDPGVSFIIESDAFSWLLVSASPAHLLDVLVEC